MSALTRADLTVVEGEARVSCRRLQEALGFTRIDSLHKLIRSREDELRDFGGIFRFEAEKSGRGRPAVTYLLNEHQAVALAMWAETEKARAARVQIAHVFVAWRRGDSYRLEQLRQAPDPFAANAARMGHVVEHMRLVTEAQRDALNLTHLPIWTNGRRPPWWDNVPLRTFLAQCHRQMTVAACLAQARARFGPKGLPAASSLWRFWVKLDRVFGPGCRTRPPTSIPHRKAS